MNIIQLRRNIRERDRSLIVYGVLLIDSVMYYIIHNDAKMRNVINLMGFEVKIFC